MNPIVETTTNYNLMIDILADMVLKYKPSPLPLPLIRPLTPQEERSLRKMMEADTDQYLDEVLEFDLVAELLGTADFIRVA